MQGRRQDCSGQRAKRAQSNPDTVRSAATGGPDGGRAYARLSHGERMPRGSVAGGHGRTRAWGAVIAGCRIACNHNYMSTEKENAPADMAGQIRGWFLGRL